MGIEVTDVTGDPSKEKELDFISYVTADVIESVKEKYGETPTTKAVSMAVSIGVSILDVSLHHVVLDFREGLRDEIIKMIRTFDLSKDR
ncbi:MAG: hypothetical protein LLG04_18860 [Parachlamydia sp.]|nr:hypothetical protein [Parachlamydia sp.]